MTDNEYLLTSILKCGTLDIKRLNNIVDAMEDFIPEKVDYMEIALDNIASNGVRLDFCSLVYELFAQMIEQILSKINEDLGIELDCDDFEIDTNYMCSSLTYLGDDEQVITWLNEHCPIVDC